MSDPPDPFSGLLFRRAVLLKLERLLREYPQRWSTATLRAVLAYKNPVDLEQLCDLLDSVEVAIVSLPRPPDSG